MKFADLPSGAFYQIKGVPNRTFQKCDHGMSVTETMDVFLCRDDIEVVQLPLAREGREKSK